MKEAAIIETASPSGRRLPLLWPLIGLALATALFRWTNADLAIAGCFYDPVAKRWPFERDPALLFIYHAGPKIGLLIGLCGCGWIAYGWWRRMLIPCGFEGAFLVLLLAIAPGLIINLGFKEHFGRPRPLQVREFDGDEVFQPVGTPGLRRITNSSFPSGHAAMGFYLIAPAFILARRNHRGTIPALLAGLAAGTLIGACRVVQGAHFPSDILWSAGIDYSTAWLLSWGLFHPRLWKRFVVEAPTNKARSSETNARAA